MLDKTTSNGDLTGGEKENPKSESTIKSVDFNAEAKDSGVERNGMDRLWSCLRRPVKMGCLVGLG